jgi:hypothetical protein
VSAVLPVLTSEKSVFYRIIIFTVLETLHGLVRTVYPTELACRAEIDFGKWLSTDVPPIVAQGRKETRHDPKGPSFSHQACIYTCTMWRHQTLLLGDCLPGPTNGLFRSSHKFTPSHAQNRFAFSKSPAERAMMPQERDSPLFPFTWKETEDEVCITKAVKLKYGFL